MAKRQQPRLESFFFCKRPKESEIPKTDDHEIATMVGNNDPTPKQQVLEIKESKSTPENDKMCGPWTIGECRSFTDDHEIATMVGNNDPTPKQQVPEIKESKSTSANDKMCGPWNIGECRSLTKELFPHKQGVHSCYTCSETGCVGGIGGRFNHSWLNAKNWWLCYVKDEGMFCLVCKKHEMKNPQNQSAVFASAPSVRFKIDAITSHCNSKCHSAALESELLQKVSHFHQEVTKKMEVESSVLETVFSSAYFLMKEFISNKKLVPLLEFAQNIFDAESLKYFKHRSARSQAEIFLSLGQTMKSSVLEKVKKASAYGLMTDEVCDVSVTENLVTFIQFFCQDSGKVKTAFLSCQDVLRDHQGANAKAIAELIMQELNDNGLDSSKFTGLATDGAAVMTGKTAGVAALLRRANPTLISVHCVCHRLALSCTDSNESITYIKTMETLLRQLWQFFENSPKRMAAYLKTQTELKSVMLGDNAKRVVCRRLKKACRTRWLSLDASVKAVHDDFEAILQTLAMFAESDATACGLLKKMRCLKFLGTIYILRDILPILSELSRFFQKDALNFSAIVPAISLAKHKLQLVLENKTPLESLSCDIDSFTNMCADITMSKKASQELDSLLKHYVEALIVNIDNRFSGCATIIAAFDVFDATKVPSPSDVGFQQYGCTQIETMANHFHHGDALAIDKLKSEWQSLKYHIVDVIKPNIPEEVKSGTSSITSTVWFFSELLRPSMRQYFPKIAFIAEVAASLPVSNAWPERGASALKNIKTRQRNRLTNAMMEAVMQIAINGPSIESADGKTLYVMLSSLGWGPKTDEGCQKCFPNVTHHVP